MNPFNYISIAQGDSFYDRAEEIQLMVRKVYGNLTKYIMQLKHNVY